MSEFQLVDQICDRFEAAWQSGDRPSVEEFLNEVPAADRDLALQELLVLEIVYRRRLGEEPNE